MKKNLKSTINFYYSYLQQNYSIMPLDKLKEFILLVNTFPLLTEEKFKIVNFKPKSIIELDLVNSFLIFIAYQ